MEILRINFLLLMFFLITIPFSYSITSMTIFDVENEVPKIEYLELKDNELEIVVFDQNGYEDISDDGYVKVVLPDKSERFALIQEANDEKITYRLILDYDLGDDNLDIEVSDGVNTVRESFQNMEFQKQGITGLAAVEIEDNGDSKGFMNIFKKIAAFITDIFGK